MVSWVRQRQWALRHRTAHSKFTVGEQIEIMKPNGENMEVTVRAIYNEDGERMESAPHPKQKLSVDPDIQAEVFDILRRPEELPEL